MPDWLQVGSHFNPLTCEVEALGGLTMKGRSQRLWPATGYGSSPGRHGIIVGFGQGLFQSPNNNAIMSSLPHQRLGIASGFLVTVRVLGQASSVALAGAIFTSLGGAQAGAALIQKWGLPAGPPKAVFIQAFHLALLSCAVIAAPGVFTSLMRGPKGEPYR